MQICTLPQTDKPCQLPTVHFFISWMLFLPPNQNFFMRYVISENFTIKYVHRCSFYQLSFTQYARGLDAQNLMVWILKPFVQFLTFEGHKESWSGICKYILKFWIPVLVWKRVKVDTSLSSYMVDKLTTTIYVIICW